MNDHAPSILTFRKKCDTISLKWEPLTGKSVKSSQMYITFLFRGVISRWHLLFSQTSFFANYAKPAIKNNAMQTPFVVFYGSAEASLLAILQQTCIICEAFIIILLICIQHELIFMVFSGYNFNNFKSQKIITNKICGFLGISKLAAQLLAIL